MLNHSPLGVFLLLPWLMVSCNYSPDSVLRSVEPQIPSIGDAEPLGPEGRASLHAILETGKLPDLRWPDFSDYREDVAKLYETYGDALPWVRGMQATAQAQAMIEVLQSAGERGLFADDYDGSRWAGRLARIKPASRDPK